MASGQELRPKGMAVRLLKAAPPFLVTLDVDRANRVYQKGDTVQAVTRSGGAGNLYLFYFDAGGEVWCVFPNAGVANERVMAGQDVHVPDRQNPQFEFVIQPPFGEELLKAVVTEQPVQALPVQLLKQNAITRLNAVQWERFCAELKAAPYGWGEVDLRMMTVARGGLPGDGEQPGTAPVQPPEAAAGDEAKPARDPAEDAHGRPGPDPPRRWGLFVGISQFKDRAMELPPAARTNAEAAAAVMHRECGLTTRPTTLLDEQATLGAIRDAITDELYQRCRPGDDVFIYWSGRLGRMPAADQGHPPARPRDYLLPHDGRCDEPESLILDSTLARWLQRLDRCNVSIILDTCATNLPPAAPVDFLSAQLVRAKSLSSLDVVLMSSCTEARAMYSDQHDTHSRMTRSYLDALQDRGPLTLYDAYEKLQQEHVPTTLNDVELARRIRLR